jgi:tetratricopeptide (TPR) repeat protein
MAIVKNIKKNEPLKLIPWLDEAGEMERRDKEEAIGEYEKIAAVYPLNEKVYDRLMILYRQLKMPKKELLWINKAIRTFEEKFKAQALKHSPKIVSISKSLIRSTGLADKKGKSYYLPEPIARWTRRKELLEKKQGTR